MRGRVVFTVLPLLGAGAFLTAMVSAQERSAPQGSVVVRPVQVTEVQVKGVQLREVRGVPPAARAEQRPTFGGERPMDPGFLSRPPSLRPSVSTPPPLNRGSAWAGDRDPQGRHGRRRSYNFKPRFDVGYGVVVGYPVIYPYAYPSDPFSPSPGFYAPAPSAPNTYSNVASLPEAGSVVAAAPLPAAIACEAAAPCGGVSFDITPSRAQVFVDGVFAGTVDEFDPSSAPLLLAPGDHYVEIRLAGHRSASFDVSIVAGEVTPYQGTLEPLRLRTQ